MNLIQPDLNAHFVKSSCEFGPIMTIYNDFPEARRVNLSNVCTDSKFTKFTFGQPRCRHCRSIFYGNVLCDLNTVIPLSLRASGKTASATLVHQNQLFHIITVIILLDYIYIVHLIYLHLHICIWIDFGNKDLSIYLSGGLFWTFAWSVTNGCYSANQFHDFWVILHFQLSHKLLQSRTMIGLCFSHNWVEKFICYLIKWYTANTFLFLSVLDIRIYSLNVRVSWHNNRISRV